MGASNEIKLKIGGDTASLERSFSKLPSMAEAAGRKAETAFNKAARYGASQKLNQFREKQAFDNASTIGKIKITTEQLSDLAYARNKTEKGTTSYLQQQLAIEQKLVTLRTLQKQAQKERAADVQAPDNAPSIQGGAESEKSGIGLKIFKVIGGIVSAGLRATMAYMDTQTAKARAQEESRSAELQSLRSTFAARRGITGQAEQGAGAMADLQSQLDFEKQRVAELKSAGQLAIAGIDKLNPFGTSGFKPLEEAEANVEKINAQIQKQGDANSLINRDLEKQNDILSAQDTIIAGTMRLKSEGKFSDLQSAKLEREKLETLYEQDIQKKRLFQGTPEAFQRFNEIGNAYITETSARRAMEGRQQEVAQALTAEAARGRTFQNGAPRGRSETERLAQRAENYRQRARAGVLTGASGVAAFYQNAALQTEKTVSGRLESGSAENAAPKGAEDFTGLKLELTNSNKILQSIKEALDSTKVD
jgi:hypothetical protein